MKFNCPKEILMENISVVSKAVSQKSPVAHLEGIYIEARDNVITLISNNTEIAIKTRFFAEIEENGEIVLNAKTLFDMIRMMPEGIIEISINDNLLTTIKNGKTKYELVGLYADGFPTIENINPEFSIKLTENKFKELIKKTAFSIGTSDTKITFTGALFEIEDAYLKVVTLDGFRMSVRREEIYPTDTNTSYIIPGKSLNELLKILNDTDNELKIEFGNKKALIKVENYEFYTRLIEGEFFNYEQIIPKNAETKVRVKTKLLADAIERSSLIITADNKSPIKLNITDETIELLTISRVGKAEDAIEVLKTGPDLEIGFNHKYILDALKAADIEEIIIDFTNNLSPCVIRSFESDDFVYLILPVRLKNE
jgi:DNA polymerase-3 subunit beta